MATHVVENQPPALENYNLFSTDRSLREAVAREGPGLPAAELADLGALAGNPQTIALGFEANEYPPELRTHDRFGRRIDEIRFHPAWHRLLSYATAAGLHGTPWRDPLPYPHLRRAAKFFIWGQVESGHGCPISMTYASLPVLRAMPEAEPVWLDALTAPHYDERALPVADKAGALCAMGMTEKQGGSDVRANQTRAVAVGRRGPGCEYLITGHKWFCSAPTSDVLLLLAQTGAGLSLFLVPRMLPDGTRNPYAIVRLKNKLGNRSNASGELEFDATHGLLIGEENEGLSRVVAMVNATRLDCAIGSAALMRAAVAQAIHHATYRRAFGKRLIEQPLMENVLAELALECEAATALFMRVARSVDDAENGDAGASALRRIGTALAKYHICKRAPAVVGEALESVGGNGYVEESVMPRLYREAPLNSIWEGSGNINALDVLRILRKQPEAFTAWRREIAPAVVEPRLAQATEQVERELRSLGGGAETHARSLTERMALIWQAALLLQHAPTAVSDAFIAGRFGDGATRSLGTLPPGTRFREIVERAAPAWAEAVAP